MNYIIFFTKIPWACIANVFRKLYVKNKSNQMNTNWDISKQKNFNQKGTDGRSDGRTENSTTMSPLTIVGRQKLEISRYISILRSWYCAWQQKQHNPLLVLTSTFILIVDLHVYLLQSTYNPYCAVVSLINWEILKVEIYVFFIWPVIWLCSSCDLEIYKFF